eukprot:TRINITY_DN29098_c0_g1_i1.p1 TRINITY_DN29098_c0_g1~~TRINITY_DN29098_c0_g1_i1.p1  ORF type:complete len:102 (-),score=25.40 TRINITY_DN29098_c0_g1_i1:170-475(-)
MLRLGTLGVFPLHCLVAFTLLLLTHASGTDTLHRGAGIAAEEAVDPMQKNLPAENKLEDMLAARSERAFVKPKNYKGGANFADVAAAELDGTTGVKKWNDL